MMRYLASIALAAALAGGTATHASALLDQDFEGHNANGSFSSGVAGGFRTLQTVTVGITGAVIRP